jgi:transposase
MMNDAELFESLPEQQAPDEPSGRVRLVSPVRDQVELVAMDLDSLLPEDHRARMVWAFVGGLDLEPLYAVIKSRETTVGRPATDPAVLMALWLYATVDGIGSARAIERLCKSSLPYRWICGGVGVNAHTVGDFRVDHVAFLDEVLAAGVASLVARGLVRLEELAQDGMRVRASAGASSFRRLPTLGKAMKQARKRVEQLKREVDDDPDASNRRKRAAQERAARDVESRVKEALEEMTRIKADRSKSKNKPKRDPRVSTTDPEARIIKMADGGFRPAWNAQVISDPQSQVVVDIEICNSSSDRGLMRPMLEKIKQRFKSAPKRYLVDGGYTDRADIEWCSSSDGAGIKVYCPLTKSKHGTPPDRPRPDDGPGAIAWRQRMSTPTGKAIYRRRAIAECIHAHFRRRGLNVILVRGMEKAKAVLLWHAIAHNMMRAQATGRLMLENGHKITRNSTVECPIPGDKTS